MCVCACACVCVCGWVCKKLRLEMSTVHSLRQQHPFWLKNICSRESVEDYETGNVPNIRTNGCSCESIEVFETEYIKAKLHIFSPRFATGTSIHFVVSSTVRHRRLSLLVSLASIMSWWPSVFSDNFKRRRETGKTTSFRFHKSSDKRATFRDFLVWFWLVLIVFLWY